MENEFIGAIKIKDGLFIGDEFAAQDLEFIITNKVTHIINCAGRQLANYWESLGVTYLTYNWLDSQSQIVFDQKGDIVNEIYNFIEEAHANGDSVLVHSERGQSRSCCVIAAYFMKRFHWTLYKTLEFLASRRPDLEIRDSFYYQLVDLEGRIAQQATRVISSNWFEVSPEMDIEELLLRNTFLNAKNAPLDEHLVNPQLDGEDKAFTINWGDERTNDSSKLYVILNDEHIMKLRLAPPKSYVKSILKGSNKIFKLNNTAKKTEEDLPQSGGLKKSSSVSGLRMNKSLKALHEEKPALSTSYSGTTIKKGTIPTGGTRVIDLNEKPKALKFVQPQTIPRSSSASTFEKEGTDVIHDNPAPLTPLTSSIPAQRSVLSGSSTTAGNSESDKNRNVQQQQGNIIHVTVNNFMAPLNNVNNVIQSPGMNNIGFEKVSGQQQGSKGSRYENTNNPTSVERRLESGGSIAMSDSSRNGMSEGNFHEPQQSQSLVDKNSLGYLASKQLKLAIEKKLSKEVPAGEDPNTNENYISSIAPISNKSRNSEDRGNNKPPRNPQEEARSITRPTEFKVNYNVLLKNRETPPPRQREEAKKNPENVYKKALIKNSLANSKAKENINTSSASYLQSLFPSTMIQLNSYTPSAALSTASQNIDNKKVSPATTKATTSSSLNFNMTNPIKPTMMERPHHMPSNSTQIERSYDKNFTSPNSYLDNYLKTTATPNSTQSSQTLPFKAQTNNFMQAKNIPVKASHEKLDRPRSSGAPLRAATPNTPLNQTNRNGLSSTSRFDRKDTFSSTNLRTSQSSTASNSKPPTTPSLRSFSPSLKPAQSIRKESPSAQASAKHRQRSSSPAAAQAQNITYNNLFSMGMGMGMGTCSKPKWKF